MSLDYDEYDALLDEPFGEDVDWAAIDLLSQIPQTVTQAQNPTSSSTHSSLAGVNSSPVLINESPPSNSHDDEVIIISSSLPASRMPSPPVPSLQQKSTTKLKRSRNESPLKDQTRTNRVPQSPSKLEKQKKRTKKKQYIRAIENILECPICFDIIASAYSLQCGHTACGMCLGIWLDSAENNHSCFICREPSKGIFVPNFSVDQLAEMHFKNKLNTCDKEKKEYHQWQSKAESGKQKIQSIQCLKRSKRRPR